MTTQNINAAIDSNPALQLLAAEARLAALGGETAFGHQALAALHAGDNKAIAALCIEASKALTVRVMERGPALADAAWTALNGARS